MDTSHHFTHFKLLYLSRLFIVGNGSTNSLIRLHTGPSTPQWQICNYPSVSIFVHTDFEIDVGRESSDDLDGLLRIQTNADGSFI